MQDNLKDKSIIVTGGSSGIGLALAKRLLQREARVTIAARDASRLEEAARDLDANERLLTVPFDATSPESWASLAEAVVKRFGAIDVLVANHGAGIRIAPVDEQSAETIEQAISVNLTSVIHGCRTMVPLMRDQGHGHIVTVGSACSYHSWPQWSVYTAAKAGLVAFTKCLHLEMVEWGGKATFFAPGAARTNFQENAGVGRDFAGFPDGDDMAQVLLNAIDVPPHVFVENVSAWGTAQIVNPF